MEKDLKDILLKDLCSRLPYGVICDVGDNKPYTLSRIEIDDNNGHLLDFIEMKDGLDMQVYLSEVKPYLFPLSSMTEEQKNAAPFESSLLNAFINGYISLFEDEELTIDDLNKLYDWFDKNHFDYRGLIPMGLAIDATNLNIY